MHAGNLAYILLEQFPVPNAACLPKGGTAVAKSEDLLQCIFSLFVNLSFSIFSVVDNIYNYIVQNMIFMASNVDGISECAPTRKELWHILLDHQLP